MSNNRTQQRSKFQQSRSKSFHFGGNRKDPLNLNDLIQKKNQTITNPIHGNDRLVEILLPPNIFDPLCLDISSSSDQHLVMQKTQIDHQQVPESMIKEY